MGYDFAVVEEGLKRTVAQTDAQLRPTSKKHVYVPTCGWAGGFVIWEGSFLQLLHYNVQVSYSPTCLQFVPFPCFHGSHDFFHSD